MVVIFETEKKELRTAIGVLQAQTNERTADCVLIFRHDSG